jgi:hypothetical protein
MNESVIERFWARVDRRGENECWPWTGHLTGKPVRYGSITIDGKPTKTHRLSWQLANGPIPPGMLVRHKCDNGACCNPAHLELGTHLDNNRDREMRGRGRRISGAAHARAVLNEEIVREIKRRIARGVGIKKISEEMGIARHHVSNIAHHGLWSHVHVSDAN